MITFNYDLIPERLQRVSRSKLLVHPPWCGMACDSDKAGKALILKVHGSVNWQIMNDRVEIMAAESDFFMDFNHEIAVGIPGPQKEKVATKVLGFLWQKAMQRIQQADTIISAGYRFPPSDAQARKDILTAIRNNESQE